jgi:predicted RNA binding protein YcfA (HicA-like mRNA interferase family)
MPSIGPIKRLDLIRYLRQLGFAGPRAGGRHSYVKRNGHRVPIPNPHQSDISRSLLLEILRLAEASREEWERL